MISYSIHLHGIQLNQGESFIGESQQTTHREESLPASVSNHSSPAVTEGGFDLIPPLGHQIEERSFTIVTPKDPVATTEKRPEEEEEEVVSTGHAPTKIEGHCHRDDGSIHQKPSCCPSFDVICDSTMDTLSKEVNMRLPNHQMIDNFLSCNNEKYQQSTYSNGGLYPSGTAHDHSNPLEVDDHQATRHSSGCDDSGVFLEELPYSPENTSGAPVLESNFIRGIDRKSPEMRQYSIDSTQAGLDSDAERSDDLGLASSSIDSADDLDGDPLPSTLKIPPLLSMKKPPPIPPRKFSMNGKCESQKDKRSTYSLQHQSESLPPKIANDHEVDNHSYIDSIHCKHNSENFKWKSEECLKSVADNKWYQRGNEKSISVKDRIAMFSEMEEASSPSKKDTSLQRFPSECSVKSSASLDSIDKECENAADCEGKSAEIQVLGRDSKWHSMYSLPLTSASAGMENKFDTQTDKSAVITNSIIPKKKDIPSLECLPDAPTLPLKVDTENQKYGEKPIISNYPQTQLTNNKRYTYGPYSLSSIRTTEDLLAKKNGGLLSIIDNRKQPLAKLKGLVIPEKPSQNTTSKNLPTIMSNDSLLVNSKTDVDIEKDWKPSMLSAASYKTMTLPRTWSDTKSDSSFGREAQKLYESPCKNGIINENTIPKYSPAFKSRTLDLPHAVTSSLSPTPPSSITSPLSPPPSSPSSVCSSNASSATSIATMQQNVFQFSLSHSKPVTPVLPEKAIMSPPSLPSDIEYEGDNSEDSSTSASPMISKLSTKVNNSLNKKASFSSNSTSSPRYEKLSKTEYIASKSPQTTLPSSGTNGNSNSNHYATCKDDKIKDYDKRSHDFFNSNGDYIKHQSYSSSKRSLDFNDQKSTYKTDYLNYEAEKNCMAALNAKPCYPVSSSEVNGSINGSKNGFIASSQETRSVKYHAQPLVFNSSSAKVYSSSVSTDFPNSLLSDVGKSYNAANGRLIDEPKTYISECEFIPSKTWNQATDLSSYRRSRLDSEDEDDSHSSLSHRTEDSRPTTEEYWSDATTDSFDKSLDPDLKPRRLSQQKVVLKAMADSTDSAQKFKALAEKWEHKSDSMSPPPPAVPSIPAPRKEHKSHNNAIPTTSSFLSSIINTSTNSSRLSNSSSSINPLKLPPSLMPRQKDKNDKSIDRRNFINSQEKLYSNDLTSGRRDSRESYDPVWYDGRSRRSSYSGSHLSDSGSSTDTCSNFSRKITDRENRINSDHSAKSSKYKYDTRGSVDNLITVGLSLSKDDNDVFLNEDDVQRNKNYTTAAMNRNNHYAKDFKTQDCPVKTASPEKILTNPLKTLASTDNTSRFTNYTRRDSNFERNSSESSKKSSQVDQTSGLTSSRTLSKSQASLRDPLENVRIQTSSYFCKNAKSISVSDIRKAFETQCSQNHPVTTAKPPALPPRPPTSESVSSKTNGALQRQAAIVTDHKRLSSLDSTTSADSDIVPSSRYGSAGSLTSISRDPYGSVTSLASTTSLISPQELQQLIDEANQSLEETSRGRQLQQEIQVIVLHREVPAGSIGITLAGGADYEVKEITVHKVISGSLADRDGRIKKGDRVISINGRNLKGTTHRAALDILKAPRPEVVLVIARDKTDVNGHNSSPDRERKLAPRSRIGADYKTEFQEPALPARSGAERRADSSLVCVQLQKDATGLGFSIEGGKDSPLGDRPLLIKRIFKGGVADKDGKLDEGDEIVSVNGQSVTAMTRTEVWNFLKKLPEELVLVRARKQVLCPT